MMPHKTGTTTHVRAIRRTITHGGEVSRHRCSCVRCDRDGMQVGRRHPEQGRPGLRVAPPGATLFLRWPVCARNGHGRSGPGALRSRPLRLRLRRSRPAPTTRGSSGGGDERFATCDGVNNTTVRIAVETGRITTPQSDVERVVGRVSVGSRLCSSFRAPFFWKGLRSRSGLGSVGVGGPPRVDPCDASPRPVPRQTLAGLSGADCAPAPRFWSSAKRESQANIRRNECALCALVARRKISNVRS